MLLLESGFLTIFLAPFPFAKFSFQHQNCDKITFWLVRWLLFRLMFASGVVKLASACPTWWGLTGVLQWDSWWKVKLMQKTISNLKIAMLIKHVKMNFQCLFSALNYHYETQVIVTVTVIFSCIAFSYFVVKLLWLSAFVSLTSYPMTSVSL